MAKIVLWSQVVVKKCKICIFFFLTKNYKNLNQGLPFIKPEIEW